MPIAILNGDQEFVKWPGAGVCFLREHEQRQGQCGNDGSSASDLYCDSIVSSVACFPPRTSTGLLASTLSFSNRTSRYFPAAMPLSSKCPELSTAFSTRSLL